jgi:hypothetical protein
MYNNIMANKILLSYNKNELKEKIIRFYFSDGGFFEGCNSIDVIKSNDKIEYVYEHTLGQEQKCNFSIIEWNEFISKLFDIEIHKWKKIYYDYNILYGEQWNLKMEFIDLPEFESSGSNEYPKNWNDFLKIIAEYFSQMKEILYLDENDD